MFLGDSAVTESATELRIVSQARACLSVALSLVLPASRHSARGCLPPLQGVGNRHSGDTLHNMGLLESLRGNGREALGHYERSLASLRKHVVRLGCT